ncbi:MAG TPA: hypothetical protein VNK05_06915 [Chloroflexota bacterium]|jgi:hypothetical protein|nr:hypothetical protein [Chloroflexota bacterium]
MSPTGLETAEEAKSAFQAQDEERRTATSRRLLRAVEQYRAACAARGIEAPEDERWAVLLSALASEPGAAAAR